MIGSTLIKKLYQTKSSRKTNIYGAGFSLLSLASTEAGAWMMQLHRDGLTITYSDLAEPTVLIEFHLGGGGHSAGELRSFVNLFSEFDTVEELQALTKTIGAIEFYNGIAIQWDKYPNLSIRNSMGRHLMTLDNRWRVWQVFTVEGNQLTNPGIKFPENCGDTAYDVMKERAQHESA